MRAGRLRHRVTIQEPKGTRDAVGERTTTWTDILTDEPAAIEPLTQKERLAASQDNGYVTHRVIIRYQSALSEMDSSWRVIFGERVFVMIGPPINRLEKNKELQLLCEEGLREE